MTNNDFHISPELSQIINGYIMGDGYLNTYGSLTVDHGPDQKKFVEWMLEQLKDLCTPEREIKPTYAKKSETNEKTLKSYRFNTRNLLKDYRENWYKPVQTDKDKTFKKCLPLNIDEMFTPLFITVWFACDGTKIVGSRGAKFEVTAFSPEEREKLKNLFKDKFQIETQIIPQGKSNTGTPQWAITINANEYDKFYALITKYDLIQKLFPYKLHKKPNNS